MAERADTVVVAASAPGSEGTRRAAALCSTLAARGEPVTLVLIGDAVWLARERAVPAVRVACLADDLALRGLEGNNLARAEAIGDGELVDLLMTARSVLGAF